MRIARYRHFLIVVLACLLACTYGYSGDNVELEEAKKHFNNGQFTKSIDLLKRLIVTKTLSKEDYLEASEYLAVAYVTINQDEQAQTIFTEVLNKEPSYKPSEWWWPHQRLMNNYYRTVSTVHKSLRLSSKETDIKTVAIIDFENNSIDDAEKYNNLGRGLSKIIIADFGVVSDLKVVERERLQYLIEELQLTDKKIGGQNIVDPTSAPQLGKLLGAQSFVFGSFIRFGKSFRIDARLVKTETGEVFKTASVEGSSSKIFELAKELTLKITKNLDVDIKKVEKQQLDRLGKQDVPIEAVALFGDAMSSANMENYKQAYAKLEEALTYAPDFQKAQDMLTVIRPLTL